MHRKNSFANRTFSFESLENRITPTPVVPSQGLAGVAIAAGHNAGSQAGNNSPIFKAGTVNPHAATTPTLPPASNTGTGTAASHNGSSQAGNNSPIFKAGH